MNNQASKPKKGKGERLLDCPQYDSCLDFAATLNWHDFTCQHCPFFEHEAKKVTTNPENIRLCEDCGEKPPISPKHRYCASCMAIRSHKARPSKKKSTIKPKDKAETQKPQQDINTALTIEFSKHVSILKEIEKLAEEEVRPVDLQIIFILKSYLKGIKEDQRA